MRKRKIAVMLVSCLFILALTTEAFTHPRHPRPPEGFLPPIEGMGGVRPISFPSEGSGYIVYELSRPAKVRIRINMSHPGAVIRTLVDWEERPAGENKEFWDGKDSAGNPIDLKNFMVQINIKPSLQARRGIFSNPANAREFKGRRHNRCAPDKCRELKIKITSPANNATLRGIVTVRVELDRNHRGYSAKAGNGLRVFLNYNPEYIKEIYFRGTNVFSWQWDTTVVPNGEHTLTINVCDHHDHVGVDTIKVNIQN